MQEKFNPQEYNQKIELFGYKVEVENFVSFFKHHIYNLLIFDLLKTDSNK